MSRSFIAAFAACLIVAGGFIASSSSLLAILQSPPTFKEAQKLEQDGNYKEALAAYRKLIAGETLNSEQLVMAYNNSLNCFRRLAQESEIDAYREEVIETHADDWKLLRAAAYSYIYGGHYGYLVAGEYERGGRRGGQGAQWANSLERDRVRGLQLMVQAEQVMREADVDPATQAGFYFEFAGYFLNNREGNSAGRLQVLTDLDELPDYEIADNRYGWGRRNTYQSTGFPVDADGKPVYFHMPDSFEAAPNDGARWRWLLHRAGEVHEPSKHGADFQLADFYWQQLGVQTMGSMPRSRGDEEGELDEQTGPFAVSSLDKNETIAKLATGVKRFELPDEFNFIRIFRDLADRESSGYAETALARLATIFQNRQQYSDAAIILRENIERFGDGTNKYKQRQLDQIIGNWGMFEQNKSQVAGQGAELSYRFRNGGAVEFEAQTINVDKLLADVKAYLKSTPNRVDWNKYNIGNIGYRLINQNQEQYLGETIAKWNLELEPRDNHYDRRVTVSTPLQQAGAYLVTAKMQDGNISRIIVWLDDTAIVKKNLGKTALYYVADAKTGAPVPGANVEFFGFRSRYVGNKSGRSQYETQFRNFADKTDEHGLLTPDPGQLEKEFQWTAIARTKEGRMAYYGFSGIWYGRGYQNEYNVNKVYVITDRPVYRPKQNVEFKIWIRNSRYDKDDVSQFANQQFRVEIKNPKGEDVLKKNFTTDAFGGLVGTLELPVDATLGQYSINIPWNGTVSGSGSFRVEEYKKPEFEVTVEAPEEPVALGEVIAAKVVAKYYFGAPVINATVKYKVTRTNYNNTWYPPGRWDWLYGNGYLWLGYNYDWYPGWSRWGCVRPWQSWWPQRTDPPEVVLENEVPIGPEGEVEIEIDTALAKELHGDQNHKYEITAEVVDASRRTIVGQGEVLVAREPFKVFAWVDRGYYRTGDDVLASFKAQTLDRKPIQGAATIRLIEITYDDNGTPTETIVETWVTETNDRGEVSQRFVVPDAGQYRVSCEVTDGKDHTREGAIVFLVRGDDLNSGDYRFNDLELIPEKTEYQPGEQVSLLINTNRRNGTVLLFLRPMNGVYDAPRMLRLDGKSTKVDLDVTIKDMPNFFVEAITISNGELHTESREIVVPPAKRVVNVEVLPSEEKYTPGSKATINVKLTDETGEPITGSTVMSVYDKSVEYISGGSNVQDILNFFWQYRRSHSPQTETSLGRTFGNLLKSGEIGMSFLGVFGGLVADAEKAKQAESRSRSNSVARNFAADEAEMVPMSMAASGQEMMDMNGAGLGGGGLRGPRSFRRQAGKKSDQQAGQSFAETTVRTKFADTAFWSGALESDEFGVYTATFDMPENLTGWKIRTWAMGHGTRVGEGEAEVVTAKNIMVRLQAPRFFVETDEVVLSAIVHNYLASEKRTRVQLDLGGDVLAVIGDANDPEEGLQRDVIVPPDGEVRVDWRVRVLGEGEAVVTMKALTDEESDAMQMKFPAFVHGMLKTESYTGVIRPDEKRTKFTVNVPAQRKPEQTKLEIRYSPTLAGALVDALPYLVEYPYGCTEQTLNRFLPTVVTQKILLDLGVDLNDVREKQTNLNAQELGDADERAKQWKRWDRNPVFNEGEVDRMVKTGVQRLGEMQISDGGWGWFSGYGERSYPHTTATVVHGLQVAVANDVAIVPDVLERGVKWLKNYQDEQIRLLKLGDEVRKAREESREVKHKHYRMQANNLDALVHMVLVDANIASDDMRDYLYRDRLKLSVYSLAMYGLSLHKQNEADKLAMVLRNIDQYLVQDEENETAYLKLPNGYAWWYWHGNEIEANAYYLKLLAKTDPQGDRARRLVKYLLNNRKHSTYWNSTRDTALCIEAMAEFLRASGEDKPEMTVLVFVDGERKKKVQVTSENLFSFDNSLVLEGLDLEAGQHEIEIRRRGTGPLYWNTYMTNFTKEEFITKAGLEVKVERKFYKLVRRDDAEAVVSGSRGQAVSRKVEKYDRLELANLSEVTSGDLVEVELKIDSKNDYEYVVFEDKKASGFEPVDLRSGYISGGNGAYVEFRDAKVAFFMRTLPRGTSSMSYRLRAEIPGQFSALPAIAQAMYAPELVGNSDEMKVTINDRE